MQWVWDLRNEGEEERSVTMMAMLGWRWRGGGEKGGAGSCLGPGMIAKSQTGQYLGGNEATFK